MTTVSDDIPDVGTIGGGLGEIDGEIYTDVINSSGSSGYGVSAGGSDYGSSGGFGDGNDDLDVSASAF